MSTQEDRLRDMLHEAIALLDVPQSHTWLCHPHGEKCPDGCDTSAVYERLLEYEAMADSEWRRQYGR